LYNLLRILQDQYTKLKLEFNWKPEPPGFQNQKFRFWGKTGDSQAKATAGAWRAALAGGGAGRWWGGAAERPAQAGRAAARGGIAQGRAKATREGRVAVAG